MTPPDAAVAVAAPGTRSAAGRIAPPTLVRYVLRELLVPTFIGFGLFTFFLLMHFLLELAELIIRFQVSAADVGRLFLYNVPHIIVLTVPMAVLVGGLIAFGRMSADSEIIAMRSGGISMYQLAVPVLLLASLATALNVYLFLEVLPWGNNAMLQLQWQLINSRTITSEVRPRVFENNFPNYTVFVEDVVGEEQRWENLLLVKTDQNPPRIVMARSAEAVYDEDQRALWLRLEDGYIYEGGETPEQSSVTSFEATEELLMKESGFTIGEITKDERSMSLGELRVQIDRLEEAGFDTTKYRVEVHKKFSIPVACMVLGLIALPLGISTQRHTKATGFLVAIGVIAVYYQLIENGEKFAEEGILPAWLGMWGADIVIGAAAIFLLWAKAREKDFGIVDAIMRGVEWVIRRVVDVWMRLRGESTSVEPTGHVDPGDAAPDLGGRRFPRILDVYVLTQFGRVFAMTLGGLLVIWMIGEYFEISDDIYAAGASRWVVIEYFKFQLPFIFMMTIPIATVLSVLIVFSLMSRQNEVVAVLAGGTSLFRLAAPILLPAVALTVIEYGISDYVVPHTNVRVAEVKASLDPARVDTSFRPAGGYWAHGDGRHVFNYADYDTPGRMFQGLHVYYIDTEQWRLARVDYADRVQWQEDGSWLGLDGWRRHYQYNADGTYASPPLQRYPEMPFPVSETPSYFATEERLPEQMSLNELRQHIDELERRGFDASRYKVDLQQKLAFPAVVFVLAIVGIPFGFRMGRQGTLSGIAIALALTMCFWLTFVFFRAVGSAGVLPPMLAAWASHLIFLALAGYITLGLRT